MNILYKIVSFKVTKNEYVITNVLWEEEDTNIFGLFFAPPYIKAVLNNNLQKFVIYGNGIYATEEPNKSIMEFIIDKYEYKNNNKFPHIGYKKTFLNIPLNGTEEKKEELKTLENDKNKHLVQKLEGTFKTTELNRLEQLELNRDYTITHIQKIVYRGVDRYIFKTKESNDIFIGNYFLEHEFKNKYIPKEHFTFRTVKEKITPTRKKEMCVVI